MNLNACPPLLEKLSYQRALGVGAIISMCDLECRMSITHLYSILSTSIEQGTVKFSFDENKRPISFEVTTEMPGVENLRKIVSPNSTASLILSEIVVDCEMDFYRAVGNIFELLAFSKLHHQYCLSAYFIKSVIPPVAQAFYIIYYNDKDFPTGFVTWARLSEKKHLEVSTEFSTIDVFDWWSGERLFVYDLVSPWGGVKKICKELSTEVFAYDDFALADRRKPNGSKRKSRYTAKKLHFKSYTDKVSLLENAIVEQNIYKISESLTEVLDFYRVIELRSLLDKRDTINKIFLDRMNKMSRGLIFRANNLLESGRPNIREFISEQHFFDIVFYLSNLTVENSFELPDRYEEQLSSNNVICILDRFWGSILDCDVTEEMFGRVFFDFRYTDDKVEPSFCKYMGNKKRIYISCAYDGSLGAALRLAHEYSHAIHFQFSTSGEKKYLEQRPIVLEFFAILGELSFLLSYLKLDAIDIASFLSVGGYSKYIPSLLELNSIKDLSYHSSYPVALVLAHRAVEALRLEPQDMKKYLKILLINGISQNQAPFSEG